MQCVSVTYPHLLKKKNILKLWHTSVKSRTIVLMSIIINYNISILFHNISLGDKTIQNKARRFI